MDANINSSSLIDLKAELYRKQEEFKRQKLTTGSSVSYVKGKAQDKPKLDLFSRKNKGVLERAQRDYEEKVEEEDIHAKSQRALEAKAKLYEKISSSSGIPEEDGSKLYLVDFQKKVIDNIVAERDRVQNKFLPVQDCLQKNDEVEVEKVPSPNDPQQEWVDYIDSLGRSRRCMKQDLPSLMKQDREMAKVRGESQSRPEQEESDVDTPSLMSNDMHRELLRQKWEKEELEAVNNTSIHYANVQFDEIRSHGVGFYQFDKSDEKRKEQMESLNRLREQTIDERSRRERLKEKRKALLDARLAKVKQRRKMKEGSTSADVQEEEIGPKLEEMLTGTRSVGKEKTEKKPVQPLTRDESWRKNAPEREWDKGKEKIAEMKLFTEDRYISERRAERLFEFAPPSLYYDTPQVQNKSSDQLNGIKIAADSNSKSQVEYQSPKSKKTGNPEDVSSIPLPPGRKENQIKSEDPETVTTQPHNSLPDVTVPLGYQSEPQWMPPVGVDYVQLSHSMYTVPGYEPPLHNMSVPPPFVLPSTTPGQTSHTPGNPPHYKTSAAGSSFPDMIVDRAGLSTNSTLKMSASYPQHNSVPNSSHALSDSAKSYEEKPAVYVPRTAILDTRLVQNVDSDITDSDVTEVKAESYKPGSFTAALQAKNQVLEDIATASRDRAHFKGGPLIYKQEADKTNTPTVSGKIEFPSAPDLPNSTEDELTAFLKEIRNTV